MVKYCLLFTVVLAATPAAEKTYKPGEVAQHKTKSDCWLTIDDQVYDVTRYVARHRDFDYDIARHCGSDASKLWHEKPGSGEAHSRKAERLLDKYRIGRLAQ